MPLKVRVPFARALLPLLLLVSASAMADSVPELRALVDANDAVAWEMAQRMEPEHAGDAEFDFWYGLAAKAAGNKQQAVFAFERVVLSQPNNARAKLELADAYAAYGNTREAKRLFNEVLATTPPEPVQQRIRTYLGALESAGRSNQTRVSSYLTLSGGYDSNVNSSPSLSDHDIGPLTFTLGSSSLETDTGFVDALAGVDVVNPVNQRTLRFLSASVQRRDNNEIFSGGNFDYSQATLTGGWMLKRGTANWRLPVTVQGLWAESASGPATVINDDRYLFTAGAEYSKPLSSRTALTWFGQAGAMHYPSEEPRNAKIIFVGGAYIWQAASAPLRLTTIARIGTEPAEQEFNGRDYVALRLNARWILSPTKSVYGALGVQQSVYQEDHPVLLFAREETLADASLGWQWQVDTAWNLNLDLSFADNNSTDNTLYDFNRSQVKLGSTWRF